MTENCPTREDDPEEYPDEAQPPGTVTNALFALRTEEETDEAKGDIVAAVWRRAIFLARQKLEQKGVSNRHVGASDVAIQSINTLLSKLEKGAYPDATDRESIWKLLARIIATTANDARKHVQAVKRGSGRIGGESSLPLGPNGLPIDIAEMAVDPSFQLEEKSSDLLIDFLAILDEENQRLIGLVAESGTSEAAVAMGWSQRTVQVRMQTLRAKAGLFLKEYDQR